MQIQASSMPANRGGSDEIDQLHSEIQKLRLENTALLDRQRLVMSLVGASEPEKIIHDIRNILNERNLLRTLAEMNEP